MIVTLTAVVMVAGVAKAGEMGPATPIASMNRLARVYAAPTPGDTPARAAERERLAALVRFMNRVEARQAAGGYVPADAFNHLQVMRDVIDAGVAVSPLAEEALVWRRVGLEMSLSYERFVAAQNIPSQHRDHARAQVELMRSHYATALARCGTR